MLRALAGHTGFDPRTAEVIVGTSAGAIAAAVLRGGVPSSAIADRLWTAEDDPQELANLRLLAGRSTRVVPRFWTGIGSAPMTVRELRRGRKMKLARLAGGLVPDGRLTLDPITRPLGTLHGSAWPDRPLWVPATNRVNGRRVVFGRDQFVPVADAVGASAALPGFFAPAEIEGRSYVDGGLGSANNADLLVDYPGLDLVVVLAPLSIDGISGRTPLASAVRTVPRRQLQAEVANIETAGTKTLVFEPSKRVTRAMGLNPMSHNRIRSILTATDRMTHRQLAQTDDGVLRPLEEAGRLLASPPDVPYPRLASPGSITSDP